MVALPPLGLSSINDQVPALKAAGPARLALCLPSADTLKMGRGCWGFRAWSGWEGG